MLSSERQDRILAILKKDGIVHSTDLMELLEVSKETIRRDLQALEQRGLLKKVYGGGIQERFDSQTAPFQARKSRHVSEKQEIAQAALALVEDGMAIALDASTTNLTIAAQLKANRHHLTVVTNSLAIACELADAKDFQVMVTGGLLHGEEMSVNGTVCLDAIRRFHVDVYFMSCNGVSLSAGVTDYGESEVAAKHAFMKKAGKVILVCSHDRFEVTSLLEICPVDALAGILTDKALPQPMRALYEAHGVRFLPSCST